MLRRMGIRGTWCIRALAVPLAAAACGGGANGRSAASRAATVAALVRAEHEFAALAADSSVQQAFVANIAEDAILFRPGPVDGPAALAAQPMPEDLALVWAPAWADISAAGDLGYTTGPWRLGTRGVPVDSLPDAGQYVTLWRRTADGFRFELDIGISHEASDVTWPVEVEQAAPPAEAVDTGVQAASDALLIADQDLAAALADGDPAAYRAYATGAVRVLRNGAPPAFGADALIIAAPAAAVRYDPVRSIVASSNDLGYTYGAVRTTGNAEERPMGYYLRIWRRQVDGSWKLALDLVSIPPG
jgi:ketosteroid isomerase-like protein